MRHLSLSGSIFAGVFLAGVGLAGVLAGGCESNGQGCTVDQDCAVGNVCRSNKCTTLDPNDSGVDGATPVPPTPACSATGGACNVDTDCCSNRCSTGRCADVAGSSGRPGSSGSSGTSGTSGTSGSSGVQPCSDLYGACFSDTDCCSGFTCQSNSCR
ncbi:hypothetical protein AKJ09_05592 [Labilithrix luteola]|uniref:Uncharacterized protein n=2 Tax=Labilithrix luteola TaxID=1391654 RepID=A0A0K1PZH5_9BACT|nr:hypothetical protein AKJ09_05592 [Labilithrix luteola]